MSSPLCCCEIFCTGDLTIGCLWLEKVDVMALFFMEFTCDVMFELK